jgi:cyclopropane-fatty-acyl-phospholipid synthase
MEKLLDLVLKRIKVGGMTVTYPDGHTVVYGEAEAAGRLHLRFHTKRALNDTARNATLGFGEAYMRGEITFEKGFFNELVATTDANKKALAKWTSNPLIRHLSKAGNVKSKQRANIAHHYDIGNDFYKLWLDDSMTYSCAYFKTPEDSLELAQDQKRRHILRKLGLKPGMRLLDIGSGWGALLIMAAKEFGATGLGVTLSAEQLKGSREAAALAGVDHLVSFELTNYQDLPARGVKYDRVVSVGMFEHVGREGMGLYLTAVNRLLDEGGLSLLHTISCNGLTGGSDAWIDKYIFPGGYLPAIHEVADLLPRHDLRLIDYESLRIHYAMTLDEWRRRYEQHEAEVRRDRGDEFYRLWQMYLASCAANFRCGGIDLSQFLLVKDYSNDLPLTRDYMYE